MGYIGKLPTDDPRFTGWSWKARCAGCGRGQVDILLMADGEQIVREHKYVKDGNLVPCPNGGKRHR